MNKEIQTGTIGAVPVLRPSQNWSQLSSGVRFHYPEDDGGGQIGGGQGGQGHQQQQQGDPNQQQQQQQQPPNPFASIDLDLLDDTTRAAVENAQREFDRVAQEATRGRDFQSRYDRLLAETQQGRQQQQPKRDEPQQPTFEQELEGIYSEAGMNAAQAKQFASLNAKIFAKFGNRVGGFVEGAVGPLAQSNALNGASMMFQEIQSQSHHLQNPDVAEKVWQTVNATIQQGGQVDEAMIRNLSKIYFVDITEAQGYTGGNQGTPQSQPRMIPRTAPSNNGTTRYTFPGAGHMVRPPMVTRPGSDLDPETQAAVAATKAVMGKAFDWVSPNQPGKVGRSGGPVRR